MNTPSLSGALRPIIVVLLGLVVLAGCDTGAVEPSPNESTMLSERAVMSSEDVIQVTSEQPEPYEAQLAALAERVPGFAGLYMDGEELVLVQAGPNGPALSTSAFRSALLSVVRTSAISHIQSLLQEHAARVEVAEYDFSELVRLKQEIGQAAKVESLVGYGIDHKLNRIVVDLANLQDTTTIISVFDRLSLPRNAVEFRFSEKGIRDVDLGTSSIDPTVGGIGISPGCTMGFNVDAQAGSSGTTWYRAFYTADHCTASLGTELNDPNWTGITGSVFYQPNGGRRIGAEYYNSENQHPSTCGGASPCFNGDVALVFYDPGDQFRRGAIARPATTNTTTWNGTDIYKVTGIDFYPTQGTAVRKVGATTGETHGTITNTCYTFADSFGGVACSLVIDGGSSSNPLRAGGDSGAPWFRVTSGDNVIAVGLHFGGSGPTRAYANNMEDLLYDQGMPDYSYKFNYDGLVR